jgi:hypothetical protein
MLILKVLNKLSSLQKKRYVTVFNFFFVFEIMFITIELNEQNKKRNLFIDSVKHLKIPNVDITFNQQQQQLPKTISSLMVFKREVSTIWSCYIQEYYNICKTEVKNEMPGNFKIKFINF